MPDPTRHGQTNVNLNPEDYDALQLLRLTRLGREVRLTDQILSFDLDTVSIVENGPAPAWTTLTGDHISFSMKHMPFPKGRVETAIWLGTNAHELGHVLFSPRKGSPLMRRVIAGETFMKGLAQLHNIVEDQRQERFLLARFSPWTDYLVAALGHHLVTDSQGSWLLFAGRTWLPAKDRDEARARFVMERDEATAVEVARLIGEYQRLTDPGETEQFEAWKILQDLHDLFADDMPRMPPTCVVVAAGEPNTDDDILDAEDLPAAADETSPGNGEGSEGKQAEGGDEKGEGGDEAKTDKPGEGGGAGNTPAPDRLPKFNRGEVKDSLKEAARKRLETNEDLDAVLDALDYGSGSDDEARGLEPIGTIIPATDRAKRLRYEVSDALMDLKDQSEPGWVKRVGSGRLNVGRVLTGTDDPELMFDRYEPGQMDSSEMELVLLLDVSGSMGMHTGKLGEATWAIRHAVDDLDGKATVMTWDSGPHRVLAQPGQRPDDRMFHPDAMGGTNPESALREAFRLLADSTARHRLMVIMTDGAWYGSDSEETIKAMNRVGITTILAYLNTGYSYLHDVDGEEAPPINAHRCQFAESIEGPYGLALLFRQIAAQKIGEWR